MGIPGAVVLHRAPRVLAPWGLGYFLATGPSGPSSKSSDLGDKSQWSEISKFSQSPWTLGTWNFLNVAEIGIFSMSRNSVTWNFRRQVPPQWSESTEFSHCPESWNPSPEVLALWGLGIFGNPQLQKSLVFYKLAISRLL